MNFSNEIEFWFSYEAVFTADITGSPLTKSWTVGFFLAKKPKVT